MLQMHKCPAVEMFAGGRYVWPLFKSYDIYIANKDGSWIQKVLIGGEGYDAEATVSPGWQIYYLYFNTFG